MATVEQKLTRRIDFLEEVIDRLQDALGILVEMEVHHKTKLQTKVNFSITLGGGVWEDAKHHTEIRDALYKLIIYKTEKLLREGTNGWFTEMDLPTTKKRG